MGQVIQLRDYAPRASRKRRGPSIYSATVVILPVIRIERTEAPAHANTRRQPRRRKTR